MGQFSVENLAQGRLRASLTIHMRAPFRFGRDQDNGESPYFADLSRLELAPEACPTRPSQLIRLPPPGKKHLHPADAFKHAAELCRQMHLVK
jgi:hypothetical protein